MFMYKKLFFSNLYCYSAHFACDIAHKDTYYKFKMQNCFVFSAHLCIIRNCLNLFAKLFVNLFETTNSQYIRYEKSFHMSLKTKKERSNKVFSVLLSSSKLSLVIQILTTREGAQ